MFDFRTFECEFLHDFSLTMFDLPAIHVRHCKTQIAALRYMPKPSKTLFWFLQLSLPFKFQIISNMFRPIHFMLEFLVMAFHTFAACQRHLAVSICWTQGYTRDGGVIMRYDPRPGCPPFGNHGIAKPLIFANLGFANISGGLLQKKNGHITYLQNFIQLQSWRETQKGYIYI